MATTIAKLIIPNLGLSKMTESGLLVYAGERITDITANTLKFPGLVPIPADLETLKDNYASSLEKVGKNGTPADTELKNKNKQLLEQGLTLAAVNCAEIANGDLEIYKLSGFRAKSKPVPVTSLGAPTGLSFKQGHLDGSVYAFFKPVKGAYSYELYVGTDVTKPEQWTLVAVNTTKPILVTDLQQLSRYYARVRAIGARNLKGDWSTVVEFKVL